MFCKTNYIRKAKLSLTEETSIKFGEDFEFTVVSRNSLFSIYNFVITKVKGDFEITKITAPYNTLFPNGNKEEDVAYDKLTRTFIPGHFVPSDAIYTFYISANVPLKEMCIVNYQLHIPVARLQLLKLYHYFKDEIVLPGYPDLKFAYYVKKMKKDESEGCHIEVHVENQSNVEIEGKEGDYKVEQFGTKDINIPLSFVFYPSVLDKSLPTTSEADKSIDEGCLGGDKFDTVKKNLGHTSQLFGINPSDSAGLFSATSSSSRQNCLILAKRSPCSLFGTKPSINSNFTPGQTLFKPFAENSNATTNIPLFGLFNPKPPSNPEPKSTATTESSSPELSTTSAEPTSDASPKPDIPTLSSSVEKENLPPNV